MRVLVRRKLPENSALFRPGARTTLFWMKPGREGMGLDAIMTKIASTH